MHRKYGYQPILNKLYIFRTIISFKYAETIIFRGIAQLVEQRSPKPRAEGSSPSAPAKTKRHLRVSFCFGFRSNDMNPRHAERAGASRRAAVGGGCSEARMAQRSKYGVTPPYFGHRKRGCKATSSPSVKTPLKSAPLS